MLVFVIPVMFTSVIPVKRSAIRNPSFNPVIPDKRSAIRNPCRNTKDGPRVKPGATGDGPRVRHAGLRPGTGVTAYRVKRGVTGVGTVDKHVRRAGVWVRHGGRKCPSDGFNDIRNPPRRGAYTYPASRPCASIRAGALLSPKPSCVAVHVRAGFHRQANWDSEYMLILET